jgi:hypothetical protein
MNSYVPRGTTAYGTAPTRRGGPEFILADVDPAWQALQRTMNDPASQRPALSSSEQLMQPLALLLELRRKVGA